MSLLEVDGLSVRFETDDGVVQAVDNLSFSIDEREVLGIVGESGCGKSVSLMSLMRLLPPTAKVDGTARVVEADPPDPRPPGGVRLPGADDVPQPVLPRRPPDRRGARAAPLDDATGG